MRRLSVVRSTGVTGDENEVSDDLRMCSNAGTDELSEEENAQD